MSELTPSLKQEAIRSLNGLVCVCGAKKKHAQSFCRECYFSLPTEYRTALYRPFSQGYVEAWDAARDYLRTN